MSIESRNCDNEKRAEQLITSIKRFKKDAKQIITLVDRIEFAINLKYFSQVGSYVVIILCICCIVYVLITQVSLGLISFVPLILLVISYTLLGISYYLFFDSNRKIQKIIVKHMIAFENEKTKIY